MPSFIENFRATFGPQPFTKNDPIASKRWGQADTSGLDKWAQRETSLTPQERLGQFDERTRKVHDNTLFHNQDFDSTHSMLWNVEQSIPFSGLQVAENADKLTKIVDDYDKAKTFQERQRVIEKGANSFSNKSEQLSNWFDNFASLTRRAADPDDPYNGTPEMISEAQRYFINAARNRFFRKA